MLFYQYKYHYEKIVAELGLLLDSVYFDSRRIPASKGVFFRKKRFAKIYYNLCVKTCDKCYVTYHGSVSTFMVILKDS